jgi:hypothetical protein
MGNGCSEKTFGLPTSWLTLRPSAATVADVLVLLKRFPCGLQTRLVWIKSIDSLYLLIEFTILNLILHFGSTCQLCGTKATCHLTERDKIIKMSINWLSNNVNLNLVHKETRRKRIFNKIVCSPFSVTGPFGQVIVRHFKFIFHFNANLCEESVPEHSIEIPVQAPNEFPLSCRLEKQKDLAIQLGWQFAMTTRQINGCCRWSSRH